MLSKLIANKSLLVVLVTAIATATNACAALQPSNASGPHSNLPPYPIAVTDPEQVQSARIAWQQVSQRYSLAPESTADINPLTGTIQSIPVNQGAIFLPKVGDLASEEEIRESLRRFIIEWKNLIGAEPNHLSLIERIDEGPNVKVARYEQRPFRLALRGGFGKLVIRFQSDRRVIGLSSTCLQNTDRLQAALTSLNLKVTSENAPALVKEHSITARDAAGQEHTFTLTTTTPTEVRQLVVYVALSSDQQTLGVHLAWEIEVTNGPIKTIYLDAVSEEVLAVA